MRILYLGNNRTGFRVLKWLKERGENIVGLVVHPPEKAKFVEEIKEVSGLEEEMIFWGSEINRLGRIRNLNPDIGISVNFGYTDRT